MKTKLRLFALVSLLATAQGIVQTGLAVLPTPPAPSTRPAGTVVGWGAGFLPVFDPGARYSKAASGYGHVVALKSDGTVVAWGDDAMGQSSVPPGLSGVMGIAAGGYHSVALKSNGTVVAWGAGSSGSNYDHLYQRGQSAVPDGLSGVVGIAAGYIHSLVLKNDGTVLAWGDNNSGQIMVPTDLGGVVSVAAGGWHNLALKSDGTVVAWGYNHWGQTAVPPGLSGVVAIAAGSSHSLALKGDGTVVAWGYNSSGQSTVPPGLSGVGAIAAGGGRSLALKSDGTVVAWGAAPAALSEAIGIAAGNYLSLALKPDGTIVAWGDYIYGADTGPPGLSGMAAIAAGDYHNLALKSDGTVVAWGWGANDNSTVPSGLSGVVAIAAGHSHSLALNRDGAVVVWGHNDSGQNAVPPGLSGVVAIAAGFAHSLALKSDGTVVAWGSNISGQSTVPPGLSGVVAIAAGSSHSLALKNDGTVVAWGYNSSGQSTVPPGLSGVLAVAAGHSHNLALKSDGTIVAWGYNYSGQSTVPPDLSGVAAIAAGTAHSLALKSDGTVVAWGDNRSRQVTVPASLGGVVAIAAGNSRSLALAQTAEAPRITLNPQSQTAAAGTTVTFTASALGLLATSYQWQFNGGTIPGATNATLTLANVQTNQSGFYRVIVSNATGSVTSINAQLSVVPLDTIQFSAAQFTASESAGAGQITLVRSGGGVDAVAVTLGTEPGTATVGVDYIPIFLTVVMVPGQTTQTVTVRILSDDLAEADKSFGVRLSSPLGCVLGSLSNATVTIAGDPTPVITTQPVSRTLTLGASATFSVTAVGATPLHYQWCFNGTNLALATNATLTLLNVQANQSGLYSVVVSNSTDSVISSNAVLSVTLPVIAPFIVAPPTNLTATAGSSVSFAVSAGGSLPLAYQWRFNGLILPGATNAILTLTNALTSQSGPYSVVVGNSAGSAASSNATLTVTVPPPVFVFRTLPPLYLPGSRFTVTLTSSPPASTLTYAVEDMPPTGWTVTNVNFGGVFDSSNRKVKFGPFFDATARTLTYDVTPSASSTGLKSFSGTGSRDGFNTVVGGTAAMDRSNGHPADNAPPHYRIVITEMTAYGTAWKTGVTNWPVYPNSIPISYVTRAGALWRAGETYRFDATTNAPLCWVPLNTNGITPHALRPVITGAQSAQSVPPPGTAESDLPGGFQRGRVLTVRVRARPAASVQVYAVEDALPAGWALEASSITEGGSFDGVSRKVKWGPFFDSVERTLAYRVNPGTNASPSAFDGTASFDGVDVPVAGRRVSLRSPWLPESVNSGRDVRRDGFRVQAQGESGRTYVLEGTDTPWVSGSWIPLATNLSGANDLDFTDSAATNRPARFYRVIEK